MPKSPKPHKIGKGGNPRPAKFRNFATSPTDGRLAAVPTVSVSIRLPAPLLARLKDTAESEGASTAETIRAILTAHFEQGETLQ